MQFSPTRPAPAPQQALQQASQQGAQSEGYEPSVNALDEWMGQFDLDVCAEAELAELVRQLHVVRRRVDGHLARIATVAHGREKAGRGAPTGDLFRGTGQLSRDEADRLAKRGRVGDDFPEAAATIHAGDALSDNMDTIALACDADWYAVLLDELGRPDAVGVTNRTASCSQRLALRALYRCCPLDGTPFDQCEIHHVNVPFEAGGPTKLENLLPVSSAWHHRIHDRGWLLTMATDRSLTLRRPDGRLDRTVGPPLPLTPRRE